MKGFVPDICRILTRYNLCHIINDYFCSYSLPSKAQWKREISNAIGEREERLLLTRVDIDPDFSLRSQFVETVYVIYVDVCIQIGLYIFC